MRALRLAVASLEAERVVLGLRARRMAVRAAFGAAAAVMLCAALAMAHVLVWFALSGWSPMARSAWLLGGDVVLAGLLGLLAMRDRPSPEEIEARLLRDTAMAQARSSLGFLPLLGGVASSPLGGLVLGFLTRRRR